MISVAGSSFITSTKTISAAVSTAGAVIGNKSRRITDVGPAPSVRATRCICGGTAERPASTAFIATAAKRT